MNDTLENVRRLRSEGRIDEANEMLWRMSHAAKATQKCPCQDHPEAVEHGHHGPLPELPKDREAV